MLKGKLTSAVLIAAAIFVCAAPGCAEKPVETTPSTTHTTWQETIPEMTETTTEPTTETTVDSAMLRDPFVGKWIGIIKVNNSNAFFTLVFNANGSGYQLCSGKTQKFKFADPDTVKKTIKITPESGKEYTISYYNGENASNKTFAFSSGMVVNCQVPSVDCLRIRGTDSLRQISFRSSPKSFRSSRRRAPRSWQAAERRQTERNEMHRTFEEEIPSAPSAASTAKDGSSSTK